MKLTKELWEFMKEKPIWWIAPMIIMVGFVVILIISGREGLMSSEFIYSLF